MADRVSFLEATALRHSTVELKKESPIPNARIAELLQHSILHAPNPFPVQPIRVLVLLNKEHDRLWDIAYECCRLKSPPPIFNRLKPDLKALKHSYGTIVFFDDHQGAASIPLHNVDTMATIFPGWGMQCGGIAQYLTWTAFCAEGLGCSLQHYRWPALEVDVKDQWDLPCHWEMSAQLVFGTPDDRRHKERAISLLESETSSNGGHD